MICLARTYSQTHTNVLSTVKGLTNRVSTEKNFIIIVMSLWSSLQRQLNFQSRKQDLGVKRLTQPKIRYVISYLSSFNAKTYE